MSAENQPADHWLSAPERQPQNTSPAAPWEAADLGAADFASADLRRRTALLVLAVLSGLGLGVFGLIATRSGTGSIGWIGLTILVLVSAMLLYRNFELAIVLFLGVCWMAVGTPAVAQGGSGSSQRLLISLAGLAFLLLVWAARILVRRDFTPYRAPVNTPIVVYLGVCIWATVNSFLLPDPNIAAFSVKQYGQVNVFEIAVRVLALGGLLMVGNSLRGRQLRWASYAILVPGLLTFAGVLPFLSGSSYTAFPQILAMALLCSFVLNRLGKRWQQVGAVVIVAAIVVRFAIVGAEWASGWMAALVALAVIVFLANRRLFWIGAALFCLLVVVNFGRVYDEVIVANEKSASFDRFKMMQGAARYATHFPLGIGLGNYRAYNSYYGAHGRWGTTSYTSAHGTYSQALSETGLPGLLALLFLLVSMGMMLYHCYRRFPPGYSKAYALGALGGFVGICVASLIGDYLFPAYHNGGSATFGSCVYVFLMIGVVMGMAREEGIVWRGARIEDGASPAGEDAPAPPPPAPIYNRGVPV